MKTKLIATAAIAAAARNAGPSDSLWAQTEPLHPLGEALLGLMLVPCVLGAALEGAALEGAALEGAELRGLKV